MSEREGDRITRLVFWPYKQCRETQDQYGSLKMPFKRDCSAEMQADIERIRPGVIGNESPWRIAIVSLAPIPIFWLLGFLLIGLGRWVRRGFAA